MQPIISLHLWVSLPNEVRYRIRALFNIPRSSNTIVSDGRIESDGTTNEDMKSLTIEKMQKYVESTSSDFHKLFDEVLAKVNDELYPKAPEVIIAGQNVNPQANVKKTTKKNKI